MKEDGLDLKKRGNIGVIQAGQSEPSVFMSLPEGIRGNGLQFGPDGNLYMADQLGAQVVRVNPKTKDISVLYKFNIPNPTWVNSPNDIAITKDGKRLYVSLLGGGLYTMTIDGQDVKKVLSTAVNGLDVSPDGTILYTQSAFYTISPDGSLKDSGIHPKFPKEGYSYTDGMRCDALGNIYVARAGAKVDVDGKKEQHNGGVHVLGPDGILLKTISVPYARVHNVGFGGPDGKTLFLVCPGADGFIASYQNDVPGAYFAKMKAWAGK